MTDSNQGSSQGPSVAILLSTYNGSRFIDQQIQSLISQSHSRLTVYIRDDGSTDGTFEVICRLVEENPGKLIFVHDTYGNLGVANSFLSLLGLASSHQYTMFCDQDDVWFPDKVSRFLSRIEEIEGSIPVNTPALVFGDMVVTDGSLEKISDSFWKLQSIAVKNCECWKKLAVSNCVTGCSSILNKDAVQLVQAFGHSPVLHDLLAAVLVAKVGTVAPLSIPTMYYRQHTSNVEGARRFNIIYLVLRVRHFVKISLPRYISFCRMISLPLFTAAWLKFSTTWSRLF